VLRRAKKSPQKLKLSRISSSWPQTRANPRNRPIPAPTPQKVENRAKSSPRTAKQAPGSLLAASWRPPPPGPFDPPNSRIRTQIWPRRAPAGAWLDPRADPPNLQIPARRPPRRPAQVRKFQKMCQRVSQIWKKKGEFPNGRSDAFFAFPLYCKFGPFFFPTQIYKNLFFGILLFFRFFFRLPILAAFGHYHSLSRFQKSLSFACQLDWKWPF